MAGSIAKRDNGRWRARYRDGAGKEHARHFPRKVDAQRWLDEVAAATMTGAYVDPRAGRATFAEYAEQWRANQVFRASTADAVEIALRRRVYPVIGDVPLAALRRDHVVGLVKVLSQTYAPSTVEVTYSYVSTVCRSAVDSRLIASSPCVGIRLPERTVRKVVPLTVEQVWRLAEAVPPRWRVAVVLAAGAGLRQGEVFGLTVDRLDLTARRLEVDRQLTGTAAGAPVFGPPKTATSVRTIPLPDVVVGEVERHLREHPVGEDGLVLTSETGGPVRKSTFWGAWQSAAREAGVQGQGFHALRHHYASLLIRHGESVKVVQARLGHKSAQETLDTYSHLWPDSDDRTREAVDAALGAAADSLRTAVPSDRP